MLKAYNGAAILGTTKGYVQLAAGEDATSEVQSNERKCLALRFINDEGVR